MEASRIHYLFERFFKKTCTEAEREELMELVREQKNDQEVKMAMDACFQQAGDEHLLSEERSAAMLKSIFEEPVVLSMYQRYKRQTWIAASFLALVAAATFFLVFNNKKPAGEAKGAGQMELAAAILPGGNYATLTTESGKVMQLDSNIGKLLQTDGATATITASGELQIHSNDTNDAKNIHFNTIATRKGGQYSIVLPDGSKVWLNASSSLRFPSAFSATERVVELSGEGYFEITKNQAAPFQVITPQAVKIEVLGTHFNVNAYKDEPSVEATLLEGSVRVGKSGVKRLLKPGEQASLPNSASDDIHVEKVNTDNIMAWRNELFHFRETRLDIALRQLERWYDIDIQYKGQSSEILVNGVISRNQPLSNVLEMLDYTLNLHHKIEGRTLILY